MDDFLLEETNDNIFVEGLLKLLFKNRAIVVNDEIDKFVLENITLQITKFNFEDRGIPVEQRKPIKLLLQSPGGNCIEGLNVVDVIKSSKTPVYTVCFSKCCSMAFHIFVSGHKRFAFPNSVLLNHDGEIALQNSGAKAKDTMLFIDALNKRLKQNVCSHTNITDEFYDSIYEKEYYMYANEKGKELGCVDHIIGEDVTLDSILQ